MDRSASEQVVGSSEDQNAAKGSGNGAVAESSNKDDVIFGNLLSEQTPGEKSAIEEAVDRYSERLFGVQPERLDLDEE